MQTNEPRIDPEIAAVLLPLTELERAHLEHSLKTEGLREPLVVWDGVLLDGHARLEIARRLGIEVRTVEIDLPDREAAIAWRLQQQIGRRNLNPVAASYFRGRLYGLLRKKPGRPKGAKPGQNARKSTDEALARQFGVDPRTCRRDSRFCEALDSLAQDFGPEFRTLVLIRQSTLTRAEVVKMVEMGRQERERFLREREEERSRPKAPRPKPAARPENDGPGQTQTVATDDSTTSTPEDDRRAFGSATSKTAPDYSPAEDAQESHDPAAPIIHRRKDMECPTDPVDEGLLRQLEELWRGAGHATRLAFLRLPAIQAALRRLDASRTQSA